MIYLQPNQWNSDDSIDDDALQMSTGQYIMDSADKPWSFSSSDNNVLRFEVQPGDHWGHDPAGIERSEIAGTTQYANGTPIDVSYAFMIEPGAVNTASWLVVGQLHQVDFTGEVAASPPFAIAMIGERMAVQIGWTDNSGVNHSGYIYVSPTDIVRGQYYNMNVAATFNPAGGGQLAVTCNGQLLATYTGPLGIAGHTGVFWKEGIYESASTETLAVDYKNLSITTGVASLSSNSTPSAATAPYSLACSYAANNVLATETVTNADQSQDIYNFNTNGVYFLSSHLRYNAAGMLISTVDYSAAGIRSFAQALNADGSTSTLNYDTSGNLTRSILNYANGVISTVIYANNALTEKFIQYTDGSSTEFDYGVGGVLAKLVQINANGSKASELFGVSGQNYVTQITDYNAAGQMTSVVRANAAGTTVFNQVLGAAATTTSTYSAAGTPVCVATNFTSGTVLTQTYTNGLLTDSFTQNPNGSTLDINYNAAGAVTKQTQINADGSKQVQTFGVTGQAYVSETDTYNASGSLISLVRDNAAGLPVFTQTTNSAGTITVTQYTPAGVLTQSQATTSAGVVTTDWYASNGNLSAARVLQPGGSYAYDTYNSQGALAQEVDYVPGVSSTSYSYNGATNANGASQYVKSATAYEGGLTFGSDGINDTFNSFGGDTFTFGSSFGTDVVNNFHAAAGANQDLIQLSQAVVPGFSALSFRQSGADTLLTIDANDSIRLTGVTVSAFSQADLKFM